jgi:hypothetical protein
VLGRVGGGVGELGRWSQGTTVAGASFSVSCSAEKIGWWPRGSRVGARGGGGELRRARIDLGWGAHRGQQQWWPTAVLPCARSSVAVPVHAPL